MCASGRTSSGRCRPASIRRATCVVVDSTPIDYLDFASPRARARREVGHRRNQQMAGRNRAGWGRPIEMTRRGHARVDALWEDLGLV